MFVRKKEDVMVIYLFLFEGEYYRCIINIGDALINKHAQGIVYSEANKHHAYSPLECITIVYISMYTYCK